MRSTSSARKTVAALLCVVFPAGATPAPVAAAGPPEPALLLTFYAADVPEETARARVESICGLLPSKLRVSRVTLPPEAERPASRPEPPEADAASVARISARLAEAARRMERMETREAALLLEEAERDARSFRPGASLQPYLAELFLRRGALLLWAGNRAGAEEMFGRARVLRPAFDPDPGLYSPAFREAWARAAARPPAGAEIVVESIPSGSDIFVNGAKAGTTPGRVRVPVLAPVRLTVARPGYVPDERVGHWLPGDSEVIETTLSCDRMSRLEELLEASGGGREAGAILDAMASAAGATRVGIFILGGRGAGARVRVLSMARGDGEAVAAGEFEWPPGADAAAEKAAGLLKAAGWPGVSGDSGSAAPWYHRWWIWVLVGVAAVGAAAGAGGGGGDSGGSTGAIGVNF